jgi:hypothetical protein
MVYFFNISQTILKHFSNKGKVVLHHSERENLTPVYNIKEIIIIGRSL